MPEVAIAAAGSIISSQQQKKGAEAAADAQTRASEQGIQFQREALEQLRSDLAPYRGFGQQALAPLSQALGTAAPGLPAPGVAVMNQTIAPQAVDVTGLEQRVQDYDRDIADLETRLSRGAQNFAAARQRSLDKAELERVQGERERLLGLIAQSGQSQDFVQDRVDQGQIDPQTVEQVSAPVGPAPAPLAPFISRAEELAGADNPLLRQAIQERQDYDPMANPLLQRALEERQSYDPTANPLLQQAIAERQAYDPMTSNPLLQQAIAERQAYDPTQALSPDILQNPLLKALQEDVTRRVMANQAARGRLGTGGTAEELQKRLVPQAIQFGLQLDQLQREGIAGRERLGLGLDELQRAGISGRERLGVGVSELERQAMSGREQFGLNLDQLQRQAMANRQQLGLSLEDIRQREIANLFGAAGIGQGAAAQTASAGQTAATAMGNLAQAGGAAQGAGILGQAQATGQMIGSGVGLLGELFGGGSPASGGGTFNQFAPSQGQWGALGL